MKTYWVELRKTLALAFPMMIGQLSMMAMAMTDAAMVGRGVGTDALAALTFALNFVYIPYISIWGLVAATGITIAEAHGARRHDSMPGILRHGILLSLSVVVVAIGGMLCFYQFLPDLPWYPYLGQAPRIVEMAEGYLYYYSAGFVVLLVGGCYRSACESLNRPWLPLGVLACAIALNVLLNWIFIFGHLGMPAMGVTGAGMATMLSNACFTVAIIVVVSRTPSFGLRFREVFRPAFTRKQVGQLADLGLPTSAQIAMEIGAFVFAAFMIGRFGAASLAAHHVTVQIAAFSFMVPLGMSFAVSFRVGHSAGAADMAAARRIGLGAFVLTAAWMVFAGLTILSFRRVLAAQFSSDPVVLDIAVQFLAVAAMFQIFDGLQTVAIGGLRGLRDTRVPTVAVGVCYWLLALPLAWFIGFHHNVGPLGVWAALAVGLALVAISMLTRFAVIASRPAKSQGNAKG